MATSDSDQFSRSLSLHERYCLSRHLVGQPLILTFGALIPLSISLTPEMIFRSVNSLLTCHAWLRATVEVDAFPPRWTSNPQITAEDVFRMTDQMEHAPMNEHLHDGLLAGNRLDLKTGPLWRIYYAPSTAQPSEQQVSTITLVVHHILSDGVGARNLFGELLSVLLSASPVTDSWISKIPPACESTMDLSPSNTDLATVLQKGSSATGSSMTNRPAPVVIWPNKPIMHFSAPRVSVFEVPVEIIKGVKTSARKQEVRTLHPVLHTVVLAALRKTFLTSSHEINIVVETPASLRSPDLGHPNVLGNFIADYKHTYFYPISGSFWELARGFARDMKDPSSRRHAIGQMGLLAHIPDTPPGTNEDGSQGDSGWEAFFRRRLASEKPSGTSLTLSNLGVVDIEVDLIGQGVHVGWAQTPSASGAAITLNFMSTAGGPLSMSSTWREGMFEEQEIQTFHDNMKNLLQRLARGEIETEEVFIQL